MSAGDASGRLAESRAEAGSFGVCKVSLGRQAVQHGWELWVGFNAFVIAMLALDLGVFHREAHIVKVKEAIAWSVVWISLAMAFNLGLSIWMGQQAALEFLTGYLIEKSLSVDNIFIFLMIFSYFNVPQRYQHKVLFLGVLGALVMRAVFIVAGIGLIERFHGIIYVFGAFLVLTGVRMSLHQDKEIHPERNLAVRIARRMIPITSDYHGARFFVTDRRKRFATPLFLVLLIIETTDLIFAVDSIPAILAISRDPFIVYTSNVFAIMGLRSLYFALAGAMDRFRFIRQALSVILIFVGVKMLAADLYKVPVAVSLAVIAGILILSVIASLRWPKAADEPESPESHAGPASDPDRRDKKAS